MKKYSNSKCTKRSTHMTDFDQRQKKTNFRVNVQKKDLGWENLFFVLASVCIGCHIVAWFKTDSVVYVPFLSIPYLDVTWFLIHFFFSICRGFLVYSMPGGILIGLLSILGLELCLIGLAIHKIQDIYVRGWACILSLFASIKLISCKIEGLCLDYLHFIRFMISPALIYKSKYKQRVSFSGTRICKLCLSAVSLTFLFTFVQQKATIPSLENLRETRSCIDIVDAYLKLSFSTTLLFILFFLLIFRCLLPVLCEVSRMDVHLYSDWWNAKSSGEFWIKWNIPMHVFLKEYVYSPLMSAGFSKNSARVACFTISGILHELIVVISLKRPSGLVFLAMFAQIPVFYISSFLKKHFLHLGNLFFWVTFCVLGQPLILFLLFLSIKKSQI